MGEWIYGEMDIWDLIITYTMNLKEVVINRYKGRDLTVMIPLLEGARGIAVNLRYVD